LYISTVVSYLSYRIVLFNFTGGFSYIATKIYDKLDLMTVLAIFEKFTPRNSIFVSIPKNVEDSVVLKIAQLVTKVFDLIVKIFSSYN
jgi:hypothetical protein